MTRESKPISPGPHAKPRKAAGWTADMDALLVEARARGLSFAAIRDELARNGFGRRSTKAVREHARRMGLLVTEADKAVHVLDCRAGDCRAGEADQLLAALLAAHKAPPADVRPAPADRLPFNWRRLVPAFGGAGSPAAMCAESGGDMPGVRHG